MSLAHDAANDWQEIMNNDIGATWPCIVTNPDGDAQPFVGRVVDISQQIDPNTEQVISSRLVAFSISLLDLDAVGFADIVAIDENDKKPWKLSTEDIIGRSTEYKVVESTPDATLGNMLLYLEVLK